MLPKRIFRFSPILITLLLAVLLTSLISQSDTLTCFFGSFMAMATLASLAYILVKGKTGKGRLYWPKASLMRGMLLWGAAALVFGLQFAMQALSSDLGFSVPYAAIFQYAGFLVWAVAGLESYRVCRYIVNPKYRPRIGLFAISLALSLGLLDVGSALWLVIYIPQLSIMTFWSKVMTFLMIPSIVSSIPFLWELDRVFGQMMRGRRTIKVSITKLVLAPVLFVAPFAWYAIVIVLAMVSIRMD